MLDGTVTVDTNAAEDSVYNVLHESGRFHLQRCRLDLADGDRSVL